MKAKKNFLSLVLVLLLLFCVAQSTFAAHYEAALGLDLLAAYLKEHPPQGNVTVAVIDSGVAALDTFDGRLTAGYDFVDMDTDPTNDLATDSHGTFLASVITAATDGLPVQIMPVRVLENKNVSVEALVSGIDYAVTHGADVLNVSIGGIATDHSAIDEAVARAEAQGVTVIVAAGNSKREITTDCPAHNESVITVSAVDQSGAYAKRYSNYGAAVDCCAPGDNVSGLNALGKAAVHSGTSFSTAYISAGAAMLKLLHPELSASQVQSTIKSICIDLGEEGADPYYGYGLPDFKRVIPFGVAISGYRETLTVDYKATVLLHADAALPFPSTVQWYVNGAPVNVGETLALERLQADCAVYFEVSDENGFSLTSATQRIHVRNNLLQRILAFFRTLFHRLPVVEQK